MNAVNLIPLHRRRAKARRARVRTWIAIDGAVAVALLAAGAVIVTASVATRSTDKDPARMDQEIERSTKQLTTVRAALAEGQQTLASSRAVSEQPDWSILLAALAERLGDEIVLSRCDLSPMKDEAPVTPPQVAVQAVSLPAKPATPVALRSAGRVLLHLSGIGRSQAAVAQFVLQLESTDLFERVNLLQSSRQEFLGGEAVAFELDCPLKGRTGENP